MGQFFAHKFFVNTLKVWERYLYWFSSYSILYVKVLNIWVNLSQHLIRLYSKKGTFGTKNWRTWELIKKSFSNFQGIFVMSLGQNVEKKKGVAVQLTKPRPLFWSGYYSQRWCRNEYNFQIFSKTIFACCNKWQGLSEKGCNIFLPQISSDLEIFHFTFLSS